MPIIDIIVSKRKTPQSKFFPEFSKFFPYFRKIPKKTGRNISALSSIQICSSSHCRMASRPSSLMGKVWDSSMVLFS
jgi:hypothetical protein